MKQSVLLLWDMLSRKKRSSNMGELTFFFDKGLLLLLECVYVFAVSNMYTWLGIEQYYIIL